MRLHLFAIDQYTRIGLIIVGAFGAYSLGANNIANVMGVFVPVAPFSELNVANLFILTGTQQLFLLGGLAIAIGAYTYSRRVMETVGGTAQPHGVADPEPVVGDPHPHLVAFPVKRVRGIF